MSINPLNALAQPISSGATHDGPPPAKAARREVETTDQKTQEVAESAIAGAAATAAAAAASAPELAPQLKKNTKAHKALNSATPSAKECSFVMTQTMATTAQARKNLMAENARKASLAAYQSSLPQNQIEDKTMKVNTNASSSFIAPPAAVAEATATATAKAKAAVREAFMVKLEAWNAAQKAEDVTRELAKATETERAALRAEKRAKEMSAAAGSTIAEQKEALAARDVAIAARKAAVMEKTVDIQIKYRNNAAAELEAVQANGPVMNILLALARAKAETAAKTTVIAIAAATEAFIAMAAAETVLAAATAAVTAERAKNT